MMKLHELKMHFCRIHSITMEVKDLLNKFDSGEWNSTFYEFIILDHLSGEQNGCLAKLS
jgi:hypothetical protein